MSDPMHQTVIVTGFVKRSKLNAVLNFWSNFVHDDNHLQNWSHDDKTPITVE